MIGGDVCRCYNDDTNGHWAGAGCGNCMKGWNPPTCTECDPGRALFIVFLKISCHNPILNVYINILSSKDHLFCENIEVKLEN